MTNLARDWKHVATPTLTTGLTALNHKSPHTQAFRQPDFVTSYRIHIHNPTYQKRELYIEKRKVYLRWIP